MFLNITGETCTGTGDLLTLTGALAGHNAFGKTGNGVDGAAYYCKVNDSNSTTFAAGIYTFDKTANTLTRKDSWNSTSSTVDRNPASNIALSAGTHTVICTPAPSSLLANNTAYDANLMNKIYRAGDNIIDLEATAATTADRLEWYEVFLFSTTKITEIGLIIASGEVASNTRVGIYKGAGDDGNVGDLILDAGLIDTSATGVSLVTLPTPLLLPPGKYFFAVVSDAAITFRAIDNAARVGSSIAPNSNYRSTTFYKNAAHTGALPADLNFDFWYRLAASVPAVIWR
jgi:hypothetical protein